MLWEEARIARKRVNRTNRTQTVMMLMAMSTVKPDTKQGLTKAAKVFNEFLQETFDDGEDD
jgi:hypothetical protein